MAAPGPQAPRGTVPIPWAPVVRRQKTPAGLALETRKFCLVRPLSRAGPVRTRGRLCHSPGRILLPSMRCASPAGRGPRGPCPGCAGTAPQRSSGRTTSTEERGDLKREAQGLPKVTGSGAQGWEGQGAVAPGRRPLGQPGAPSIPLQAASAGGAASPWAAVLGAKARPGRPVPAGAGPSGAEPGPTAARPAPSP